MSVAELNGASKPGAVTFENVLRAQRRVQGQVLRTSARRSRTLEQLLGAREVWLKCENRQRTGSFKERGAINALTRLDPDVGERGLITASTGNHATALAYHASGLGYPVSAVMPANTSGSSLAMARRAGAHIIRAGADIEEALADAAQRADAQGLTLIHPYDDAAVAAGQGTAVLELLEDAPSIEVVPVPVGGGGLIAGAVLAAEGVRAAGGPSVEILGVEPEMYPSLANALADARMPVGGETIAHAAAITQIGAAPREILEGRLKPEDIYFIDESAIEEAIIQLVLHEKIVVEGAGACGLAAMIDYPERFEGRSVGIILCGGNIEPRMLANVLSRQTEHEVVRSRLRVEGVAKPDRISKMTSILNDAGVQVLNMSRGPSSAEAPFVDLMIEVDDEQAAADAASRLSAAGFESALVRD